MCGDSVLTDRLNFNNWLIGLEKVLSGVCSVIVIVGTVSDIWLFVFKNCYDFGNTIFTMFLVRLDNIHITLH